MAASSAETVQVRSLRTAGQMQTAADLLASIWVPDGQGEPPVETGMLVALEHAGNYVSAAFAGEQMVGATVGFLGLRDSQAGRSQLMHSHLAGVLPAFTGQGIGAAMKQHQRAWCLERGIGLMEWTFDPLVARNARFNLHKLGAAIIEYLPDFYGEMRDGINAGQGSDRALISWNLPAPQPAQDPEPVSPHQPLTVLDITGDAAPLNPLPQEQVVAASTEAGAVHLRIPQDIEALRRQDPGMAAQWRLALGQTMGPLMSAGWSVSGISREGQYLLRAPTAENQSPENRG